MYPLQKYVIEMMKARGIKKTDLVRALGYRNIAKGIRRLESFLDGSDQPRKIIENLHTGLKRKTAAGYFRKKYFMMRRILASPNLHMYENTVRIDDRLIVKEVVEETRPERLRYSISHKNTFEICKENLAALNVALQYKLEDEAFKNTFRTVIRPDLLNLKANSGRAVCPFDGVVEPVTVIISSPLWTWRGLCGREYTGLLCPECLGIVSPFTLARMS